MKTRFNTTSSFLKTIRAKLIEATLQAKTFFCGFVIRFMPNQTPLLYVSSTTSTITRVVYSNLKTFQHKSTTALLLFMIFYYYYYYYYY